MTPNDILTPGSDNRMMMIETSDKDICSRNAWRRAQHVVNCFWHRWAKEYLPTLIERRKWRKVKRNFQVGDIILVATDNTPREKWPLGRITETFPDEKGHVRSVMLTSKNNKYKRPIAKLVLLLPCEENFDK